MFDYRRACFLKFIMNPVPLIYNYIFSMRDRKMSRSTLNRCWTPGVFNFLEWDSSHMDVFGFTAKHMDSFHWHFDWFDHPSTHPQNHVLSGKACLERGPFVRLLQLLVVVGAVVFGIFADWGFGPKSQSLIRSLGVPKKNFELARRSPSWVSFHRL